MNKDTQMLLEAYGTIYRGSRTEQDSKDYGMNLAPFMHIIHKLAKGTFDTNSDQDHVAKGELQGIFEVDVVDDHRQVVLTNDAVKKIEQMYPELKDKFWECGRCKADYKGCGEAKHDHEDEEGELMKHMKDKGMIDSKATDDTGKYGRTKEEEHYASEDEQRRLDPKCWKGYHKQGTKLKDGVRVNNCVKN